MSTIVKALNLLNHFSDRSSEIGLTRFRELSRLDKGTVHRYLTALKQSGYLEQNQTTKAYRLGPAIVRLAAIRERTFPVGRIVASHLDNLADETRELVHAALPQSGGMSSLYHRDGGVSGTRVGFDESDLLPFHATSSGIAQLAFGPPGFAKSHLQPPFKQYTNNTKLELEDIEQLVENTREQGYSFLDQSYEAEVRSIAVPFFDNSGFAAGTIAIATPVTRMTEESKVAFLGKLTTTSQQISQDIGGAPPTQLERMWRNLNSHAPNTKTQTDGTGE